MSEHSEVGLAAHLMQLEAQLIQPEIRRDRDRLGSLLAEGFREFGSSGHEWSRDTILDLLAAETAYDPPAIEAFTAAMLSPEAALVTYRVVGAQRSSLRSSVWVWRGERWQLLFHQGTVCVEG